MQKGKEMRKRRLINKFKKGFTVAMAVMAFMSTMLYAFYKPSAIYGICFFLSIAWCMAFVYANGGAVDA